jgi:hypothetical protein
VSLNLITGSVSYSSHMPSGSVACCGRQALHREASSVACLDYGGHRYIPDGHRQAREARDWRNPRVRGGTTVMSRIRMFGRSPGCVSNPSRADLARVANPYEIRDAPGSWQAAHPRMA